MTGFEPAVSALTGQRVGPLHHTPQRREVYHAESRSVKKADRYRTKPTPRDHQRPAAGKVAHSFLGALPSLCTAAESSIK